MEKVGSQKKALGKGFNSLLGLEGDESSNRNKVKSVPERTNAAMILEVDVARISPNPNQPRKVFDQKAIESLAKSIEVDGVIQPIIVRPGKKPQTYELIAGERRWRAAQKAGLRKIPIIVREPTPEVALRVALIENIQRQDLNIIEEAMAYQLLIDDFSLTQEECGNRVGKDRATVSNAIRMLALPNEVQEDLMNERISMGHGRALLSLEDKKAILRARDLVVAKKLSVRQTENLCKKLKNSELNKGSKTDSVDPDLEYVADAMRSQLRTKVRVIGSSSSGRIEVNYFSAAELERIVSLMGVKLS